MAGFKGKGLRAGSWTVGAGAHTRRGLASHWRGQVLVRNTVVGTECTVARAPREGSGTSGAAGESGGRAAGGGQAWASLGALGPEGVRGGTSRLLVLSGRRRRGAVSPEVRAEV